MDITTKTRINTVLKWAPIPLLMVILSPLTTWVLLVAIGLVGLFEWRRFHFETRDAAIDTTARYGALCYILIMLSALIDLRASLILLVIFAFWLSTRELRKRKPDQIIAFVYISLVALLAYALRAQDNGLAVFGLMLVISIVSDSAAYFVGRAIGRHKFAPRISPNKTWEGAIGGQVIAAIFAIIYCHLFLPSLAVWPLLALFLFFVLVSFAGQLGDLGESALKRRYGVKDSGTIFPGHGGVLDRFDSISAIILIFGFGYLVFA